MSDNVIHDLLLENMKAMRGELARLTSRVEDLTVEMRSSNEHLSALFRRQNIHATQIADTELRLDRLERRMDVLEAHDR